MKPRIKYTSNEPLSLEIINLICNVVKGKAQISTGKTWTGKNKIVVEWEQTEEANS